MDGISYPQFLFSVPYQNVYPGKITLRVEGEMPDETGEVQMTVGAVYFAPYEPHTPVLGIAHLLVTHSTLDYFYVSTEHDTMAFTEMTRIFVEAKDKDGRDVDLPAGTMISVALSTSVQYGGLEYGGRRGIIIDNIPYHDAQSGKVRFAADGEIPMEPNPQPVAIQVSGEGKTGSGVVWVRGCGAGAPECGVVQPTTISLRVLDHTQVTLPEDPCMKSTVDEKIREGVFEPLNEVEDFVANPCFDRTSSVWRFSVDRLSVRVLLAICDERLKSPGYKVVNNTDEIPDSDVCEATQHIAQAMLYGAARPQGGYILKPASVAHENVHRMQYEGYLLDARKKFDQELAELLLSCEKAVDIPSASTIASFEIAKSIESLLARASQLRREAMARGEEHERETHRHPSVTDILDEAYNILDDRCTKMRN